MKFLVLMAEVDHFDNWEATSDEVKERVYADFAAFEEAVAARGAVVGGQALDRTSAARTLRPSPDGPAGRVVTDGPYAETAEQLGGFFVVDLPDLDTAVEVARLLPREYHLEVRPVVDVEV